jgi:hypothetical protein
LVTIPAVIFYIYNVDYGPNLKIILQDIGILLPPTSKLVKYDLLNRGPEVSYLATFSFESRGEEICTAQKFDRSVPLTPSFSSGKRGEEKPLGTGGICYGVKEFSDRLVFFAVHEKEIRILVMMH